MKSSKICNFWMVGSLFATLFTAAGARAHLGEHDVDDDQDALVTRELAQMPVRWQSNLRGRSTVEVKLLAFNDFHGQISAGKFVSGRPVGGAAVLASYLDAAAEGYDLRTLIVHAGDHVGASPAASALLQDEPAIEFLNMIANPFCSRWFAWWTHPYCNVVGTLGNHEFDEGVDEMLRLVLGGNHADGPFLTPRYRGANFPYVSANVIDVDSGEPVLPPWTIRSVAGARVGFIGIVLEETPTVVTPTGVAGVSFLDEAESVNRHVSQLRRMGVESIVVTIHQGGRQTAYVGPTLPDAETVSGPIADIVYALDDAVDVVVSGHSHAFTNALMPNQNGKPILVTQAFSAGTAFADITLTIDRQTRDVVAKQAAIVTTYADEGPGLSPVPEVEHMVSAAEEAVEPLVAAVVGDSLDGVARTQTASGESALGNLIADAQRAAMGTDFAFMNPGGIRADIPAGEVTWGDLFTVQPFGNSLVQLELTGAEVRRLLEQQWVGQTSPRMLQVSGLQYTWDANAPEGQRIVEIRSDGSVVDDAATYRVTVNSFLAAGGDGFTVLVGGRNPLGGPVDLDALIAYIAEVPQPFAATVEGRIQRVN